MHTARRWFLAALVCERISAVPSAHPSSVPTTEPSAIPEGFPSATPTTLPSKTPTNFPSVTPTRFPSATPTSPPSAEPTSPPSATPTSPPSATPTNPPSSYPTDVPASAPTIVPTSYPTVYQAVRLSKKRAYAEEGKTASYTLELTTEPTAYVLVNIEIASNSALATVTTTLPLNFTTTTWSIKQTVMVEAVQNSEDSGAISNDVALVHSARSIDPRYNGTSLFIPSTTMTLRIYDDDSCVRDCRAGTYFSICNNSQTCVSSPPGYYALGGCTSPVPCPRGTFSAEWGGTSAASCRNCSLGNYSSTPGAITCSSCPAGYSCPNRISPQPCATGRYSRFGDGTCTSCERGRYNAQTKQTTCSTCPAGYACADVSSTPEPCSPASYSLGSAVNCSACPAGYMCSSTSSEPQACESGSYALYNWGYCLVCPGGFACGSTQDKPVECAPGTATLPGSTECAICASGRYANGPGFQRCIQCPRGFSCLNVSASPVACNNGTYSGRGDATCSSCPSGTTSGVAAEECTLCPAGYECPIAGDSPTACETGSYSETGFERCLECEQGTCSSDDNTRCVAADAGFQCGTPSLGQQACDTGYYSLGGNVTSCSPIPRGYFALSTSTRPRLCPSGTVSPLGQTECQECSAGYACPSPEEDPTACDSGYYSLDGSTQCTPCPAGYSCSDTDRSPIPCARGSYALVAQTECTDCPAGYKCTSSMEEPSTCPGGTYSLGNSTDCYVCPAAHFCETTDAGPVACANSMYSSAGATECRTCPYGFVVVSNNTQCDPCPAGSYCPYVGRELAIPCPSGSYSTGAQSLCTACAPGWYCPYTGRATRYPCNLGTFSDAGQASCTECPAGFKCPTTSSSSLIACRVGSYSRLGDPYCHACPAGYYCLAPSDEPVACPSGTFSFSGSSNCTTCPAGHACSTPEIPPSACPVGFWSMSGALVCSECSPGYHCSEGSTSPAPFGDEAPVGSYSNPSNKLTLCPIGTYGNKTGGLSQDDACVLCPAGFYCQAETAERTEAYCIEGHFCPSSTSSWSQYPCPAGTYSSQTGLHDASQCETCILGHFCPERSTAPTACSAGTYNPRTGARSPSACISCEAGWSCPTPGMWYMTTPCDPGHWCSAGTWYPDQNPCPAGTYTDQTNLTDSSECATCPARHVCVAGSTSVTIDACTAGYYCPAASSTGTANPCPAGKWSNKTNLASGAECALCPAGYYCDGGESSVSGTCTAGYVCPLGSSSTTAMSCPAGRYASDTNLYTTDQCTVCPAGSYCLEASTSITSCPAGRFSPNNATRGAGPVRCDSYPSLCTVSAAECITCLGGYYCPFSNSTEPIPCGIGYYSSEGASECTTHYCGSRTTNISSMLQDGGVWKFSSDESGRCFNGTWCPAGMERAPTMATEACPAGYYCPTATEYPLACPAGTYSPFTGADGDGDCKSTPEGYYTVEASSNLTGLCNPGYYCGPGSTGPQEKPCPAMTYNPYYGRATIDDCSLCARVAASATQLIHVRTRPAVGVSGGYCPEGSSQPSVCPRGYFCITGVEMPSPCPDGTFGNESGLRRVEDCSPCLPGYFCDGTGLPRPRGLCDPGYYCIQGSNTSAPNAPGAPKTSASVGGICPAGGYCPVGSSYPTACPAGTFGNESGLASSDECANCLAGYYCAGSNNPYPSGRCYAGYYCISASTSPTQYECEIGKYSSAGASECSECEPGKWQPYRAQSSCAICPAGYYCDSYGATKYEECPQGYYCPEGISDYKKYPCPAGTFGAQNLLQTVSECTACTAGNYCEDFGATSPTGDCAAGYYCSEGAFDEEGQYCFDLDIYEADYDPATDSNITDVNVTLISYLVDCGNDGGPCTSGHFCLTGAGYPEPCPLGTCVPRALPRLYLRRRRYYPYTLNKGSCTICDPGYACDTTGLSTPVTACAEGYFCANQNNGAESATPLCPSALCEADYGICPAGHYCRNQTTDPVLCSAGRYAPAEGLSSCLRCPAGNFCNGTKTHTYFVCPRGSYCVVGTGTAQSPCPPGRYGHTNGLKSELECATCPAGKFCPSYGATAPAGNCLAAYYCPEGSISGNGTIEGGISHLCPSGSFCSSGSKAPHLCPVGKFSMATGATDISTCASCLSGRYCNKAGLASPTGEIEAGYYGGRGVTTPRPENTTCPTGHACPRGSSSPIACDAGRYASVEGLAACVTCPAGFYCQQGATEPLVCPKGYVCPQSTENATAYPCPMGYWSNKTQQKDFADCLPIPPGYYATGVGSGALEGLCIAGYYCSGLATSSTPPPGSTFGGKCGAGSACTAGSTTDVLCPGSKYCDGTQVVGNCSAGYYCTRNATSATPLGFGDDNGECPPGHYCERGSITPQSCVPGTYSNSSRNTNAGDCEPCLAGFVCANASTAYPSERCPVGYYCFFSQCSWFGVRLRTVVAGPTGSVLGLPCSPGTFCVEGSVLNLSCPAGRYQPLQRQSSCLMTPRGYYSEAGASRYQDCPKGYYCPSGTKFATEFPCPNSTFSNFTRLHAESQCTPCLSGRFCNTTGLSEPAGYCRPGYFCSVGGILGSPADTVI